MQTEEQHGRREEGREGEEKACKWLESRGFKVLARNYSTQFGEIDIIALYGDVLHFIEVKTYQSIAFSPRYAITAKKLQRIYASIDALFFTCKNLWSPPTQARKPPTQAMQKAQLITEALQAEGIPIDSCQYCVDALLIWQDTVELLENISLESSAH